MTERTVSPAVSDRVSSLSVRETEIATRYASGQTSREIAGELCISQTTVRNHVATIYRKLQVSNKTGLIGLLRDAEETNRLPNGSTDGGTVAVEGVGASATERALANSQAQQRAISEVLRVISHTPGDIDAVFDVILDYALQLSHSQLGIVWLCADKGFRAAALKNVPPDFEAYLRAGTIHPGPETGLGRMSRQHRVIHIHDVRNEALYRAGDPLRVATADLGGARSFIAIPMIHRDALVGALTIYRLEVKPFEDDEFSLLQAFSDQAAIALTITQLIDDRAKLLEKLKTS